jgi:hypothetical protein
VALQSVEGFPFPRVVIFHAVPMSMPSLSYRAGHLWRGDIPPMDLKRSCFPTKVRWKVFYCPPCSDFIRIGLSVGFSVVNEWHYRDISPHSDLLIMG